MLVEPSIVYFVSKLSLSQLYTAGISNSL